MKQFNLTFLLLFTYCVYAQSVSIPDPIFKTILLNESIARDANDVSFIIDTNNDGEIQITEAQSVFSLHITNTTPGITDIAGIENFTNLKTINISGQNIPTVNLTGLLNLEEVRIEECGTTNINTTGLTNLKSFICFYNMIADGGLDLSTNLSLEQLGVSHNQLTTLNVNFLTNLKILDCTDNNIPLLELTNLEHLVALICYQSHINTLNLTGLINLQTLDCTQNLLTSLNVNGFSNLKTLSCNNNAIAELDLSFENELTNLSISYNNLTLLDVSGCHNLTGLSCSNNSLTSLDLSQNPSLKHLFASNNLLESINLKNGGDELYVLTFDLMYNPNLAFVCVDEEENNTILNYLHQKFPNCVVNSYCSFVPGGDYYALTGTFKYDENVNGCDENDNTLSLQGFTINNGTVTDTVMINETTGYTIGIPAGTYTLMPLNPNPAYFSIVPQSQTITFPNEQTPYALNFCVTPIGAFHDLDITLLPITPARPGFDAVYRIIYRNKGNTTQFASIFFTYDDTVLDFVASSIVPNGNNPGSLFWEIPEIKPFEEGVIDITLNANAPTETPALNIDDVLHFEANIQNPIPEAVEQTPLDNTYKLDQIVVGSFDPNDKTCVEGTTITPEMAGEYVTYMIRFENTGTHAAENVVVQDKIDLEKFEISSLTPLRSSHPFVTRITKDNNVEFIFENIMLPGMPSEERHGYVAFKIKTKATLQLNDTFSNTAAIYFDYNAPVITNEAVTTFAITQSNPDFDFNRYITLYPNPTATVVNLEVRDEIMIESLEVYNIMGQMVLTMPKANNTSAIDVASLASGTYILKVNSNKGTTNSKFIKK